jgi:hypothetical protein
MWALVIIFMGFSYYFYGGVGQQFRYSGVFIRGKVPRGDPRQLSYKQIEKMNGGNMPPMMGLCTRVN